MWLLWSKIFAFSLLAITFIYLRTASAVLRSLFPKSLTAEMGLPLTAALFVAPSVLLGLVLYWAQASAGIIWISVTAIYFSWGQDLVYVTGVVYYYFVLRRIRRSPASFDLLIRLEEYAAWPSTDVVRRPLDYLLHKLPLAGGLKKTTVLIKPADFRRFLNSDLRLIDEAALAVVSLNYAEFCAVPHFSPPARAQPEDARANFGKWRTESADAEPASGNGRKTRVSYPRRKQKETNDTRYYILNRALHAGLNEELWATSRSLCETPPSVIARTWKTFHFQESTRLRFAALFSAADLLQRLIGSVILCTLRDEGALSSGTLDGKEFRVPSSTLHWTSTIESALAAESSQIEPWRRILLGHRDDYEEWQERLSPFGAVLGTPILFPAAGRHALAGWRMLGVLRNKVIGHGGIGTHLRLRPLLYLSAAHHFFLSLAKEIVTDLVVYAAGGEGAAPTFIKDQGLGAVPGLSGDHAAFARPSRERPWVSLHPYLRYHDGRLLVMNRMTKEGANYIDYNVANIFEPSYITLKAEPEEFTSLRTP